MIKACQLFADLVLHETRKFKSIVGLFLDMGRDEEAELYQPPRLWPYSDVRMPSFFPNIETNDVRDILLWHDNLRNTTVGVFLLKSGELQSYFLENNYSRINYKPVV